MLKVLLPFILSLTNSAYKNEDDQDVAYIQTIVNNTNQQYLKSLNEKFLYKYVIDYYTNKIFSWSIIIYQLYNFNKKEENKYGNDEKQEKNYIDIYMFLAAEIASNLVDLLIQPYSLIGELIRLSFFSINIGFNMYKKEDYKLNIGLITLSLLNILTTKRIEKIRKTSDIFLLQNMRLNDNIIT